MKEQNYIKATSEGRLYIETKDFFKQPKIQKQIKKLMESKIVKDLNLKKQGGIGV